MVFINDNHLRTGDLFAFLGPNDGCEVGGDIELSLQSSLFSCHFYQSENNNLSKQVR